MSIHPTLQSCLLAWISELQYKSLTLSQVIVISLSPSLPIRAVTIQSAVIVRPDLQDPRSTRMTLLFQTDFGGRLPKFMVNFFSAFAPPKWRRDMYNFYNKVYSKEKNCDKVRKDMHICSTQHAFKNCVL